MSDILAIRKAFGTHTPIECHCTAIAEMRLNFNGAQGEQRKHLLNNLIRVGQALGRLLERTK